MPRYAASWCEENVWWLAHELPANVRADVVFVTNRARSVAVWSQRARRGEGEPVVWDYHVVLVRPDDRTVVDLDCTLGAPIPAARWLDASFPVDVEPRFRPTFRVLDAHDFARRFRSDRSHMKTAEGWLAPLPPWPAIDGGTVDLARFLDLDDPVAATRSLDDLGVAWRVPPR